MGILENIGQTIKKGVHVTRETIREAKDTDEYRNLKHEAGELKRVVHEKGVPLAREGLRRGYEGVKGVARSGGRFAKGYIKNELALRRQQKYSSGRRQFAPEPQGFNTGFARPVARKRGWDSNTGRFNILVR